MSEPSLQTVGHLLRGDNGSSMILLGTRSGLFAKGILSAPGGKCEGSERPLTCLARELQEEVGVKINRASAVHFATVDYFLPAKNDNDNSPNRRVHFYDIKDWSGTPRAREGFSEVDWYSLHNLPYKRMFPDLSHWFPTALLQQEQLLKVEVYFADTDYKSIKLIHLEFVDRVQKRLRKNKSKTE